MNIEADKKQFDTNDLHLKLLCELAEILKVEIADLPKVFHAKNKRVLKIGFFDDLAAAYPEASKDELRHWIIKWTRTGSYLHRTIKGTNRHDLDGENCGLIEQSARDYAHGILKNRENRKCSHKKIL